MLWLDGRLQEASIAPFDLCDRGLLLGDGVFDTAMSLNGRVIFEAEHVERLDAATKTLGYAVDPDRVVAAMRALAAAIPRAAIRTTTTRGTGPRGLAPPAATQVLHWASAAPLRDGMAFAPMRLLPVAVRRNETSPTAGLKTLGYLDAVLAAREAVAAGYDEALFLNTRDRVACAGTGNLFSIEGTNLVTPRLGDGALPGIVREKILSRLAPELGLRVEETSLSLARLKDADAVFLTNSLRLIAPVDAIGQRNIPSSSNAVLNRLKGLFHIFLETEAGLPPGGGS